MSKSPGKAYAIYVRVSSDLQAQSQEGSITSQQQRCQEYLRFKYGIELPILVYREEGKSGKDTNRPQYQRLVSDILAQRIEVVCCTELSRISRSVMDFHQFLALCNEQEVGFVSLREQFDTTTAHGKLMMSIFASFAQFEREQISERTSANLQARARRGLYNGGYVYGYRPRPGQKGYLDIDQNEAVIINLMFDKYCEFGSYCEVANWLNQNGYRTREYRTRRGRLKAAALWNKNTVIQCLKNPIFIGKRRLRDGKTIDGVWEPLVTQEKFNQVQALLANNLHSRSNTVALTQHIYLFSSLLQCMHCGIGLENGSGTGNSGRLYFYYRHPAKKRKPGCFYPASLPAAEMEQFLYERLILVLQDGEMVNLVCEEVSRLAVQRRQEIEQQIAAIARQMQGLETEVSGIVQKLPLLLNEHIREFITPRLDQIIERKRALQEGKRSLEEELLRVAYEIIRPEDITRTFYALSKDFWLLRDREKKELFHELVDKIEMYPNQIVVFVREVCGGSSEDTLHGCPRRVSQRTFPIKILQIKRLYLFQTKKYNPKATDDWLGMGMPMAS